METIKDVQKAFHEAVVVGEKKLSKASCGVKIPIIGTFYYKNIFMQEIST